MKNLYMVERVRAITLALLLFAGGVLFISMPESFYKWLAIIFGIIIIAVGMVRVVLQFTFLVEGSSSLALVTGFTLIGFGALMICFPEMFIQVSGVVMSLIGVQHCGESFERYRDRTSPWWKDLLYGITLLVLGLAIVIMKYLGVKTTTLAILSGIALILYGLFVLIGLFASSTEQEGQESLSLLTIGNRGVVEIPLPKEVLELKEIKQETPKGNTKEQKTAEKKVKKVAKLSPTKKDKEKTVSISKPAKKAPSSKKETEKKETSKKEKQPSKVANQKKSETKVVAKKVATKEKKEVVKTPAKKQPASKQVKTPKAKSAAPKKATSKTSKK